MEVIIDFSTHQCSPLFDLLWCLLIHKISLLLNVTDIWRYIFALYCIINIRTVLKSKIGISLCVACSLTCLNLIPGYITLPILTLENLKKMDDAAIMGKGSDKLVVADLNVEKADFEKIVVTYLGGEDEPDVFKMEEDGLDFYEASIHINGVSSAELAEEWIARQ